MSSTGTYSETPPDYLLHPHPPFCFSVFLGAIPNIRSRARLIPASFWAPRRFSFTKTANRQIDGAFRIKQMRAAIGAAITVTDTTIELTSVKTDAINLDVLRLDRLHVAASDLLEDQQANIVPAGQAGGIEPAPLSCEQGNRKLPRLRFTFRSFTSTAGSESSTGATAFTPLSG